MDIFKKTAAICYIHIKIRKKQFSTISMRRLVFTQKWISFGFKWLMCCIFHIKPWLTDGIRTSKKMCVTVHWKSILALQVSSDFICITLHSTFILISYFHPKTILGFLKSAIFCLPWPWFKIYAYGQCSWRSTEDNIFHALAIQHGISARSFKQLLKITLKH